LRDTLKIIIDADEKTALALAIKLPKIAALINQQKIKKVIYVKNRILNLIV
jgi:leucyl-tRNA synthetase